MYGHKGRGGFLARFILAALCVLAASSLLAGCWTPRGIGYDSPREAAQAYADALAAGDRDELTRIVGEPVRGLDRQQRLTRLAAADPTTVEQATEFTEDADEVWKVGGSPYTVGTDATNWLYLSVGRHDGQWFIYDVFISHDDSQFLD